MKLFRQEGCESGRYRLPGADFAALRCYGGGGGSSAQTSASTQATTAGASSPQTTGTSSPVNTGQSQVNANGAVTFNSTTDPEAWSAIQTIVTNALNNNTNTQNAILQTQNSSNDAVTAILDKVTAAAQATAANQASGGETNTNKTVLYVVFATLAGLFGLGWLFTRNNKK